MFAACFVSVFVGCLILCGYCGFVDSGFCLVVYSVGFSFACVSSSHGAFWCAWVFWFGFWFVGIVIRDFCLGGLIV